MSLGKFQLSVCTGRRVYTLYVAQNTIPPHFATVLMIYLPKNTICSLLSMLQALSAVTEFLFVCFVLFLFCLYLNGPCCLMELTSRGYVMAPRQQNVSAEDKASYLAFGFWLFCLP